MIQRNKSTANKILLMILFVVFFSYGCATVGKNFSTNTFSWIVPGETTKDDVHARLSEPFRVGIDAEKLTWTYGYYKYRTFGSTCTKDLVFYFNKNGTVDSYTFNTSFPEEKAKWRNRISLDTE